MLLAEGQAPTLVELDIAPTHLPSGSALVLGELHPSWSVQLAVPSETVQLAMVVSMGLGRGAKGQPTEI